MSISKEACVTFSCVLQTAGMYLVISNTEFIQLSVLFPEYNVDQWNDLTSELSADELEDDISAPDSLWQDEPVQIDTKIKDITKHYSALKDRVHKNSHDLDSVDFKEGRVEELWNLALEAGFERDDLTSLRVSSARRKLELLKVSLRVEST